MRLDTTCAYSLILRAALSKFASESHDRSSSKGQKNHEGLCSCGKLSIHSDFSTLSISVDRGCIQCRLRELWTLTPDTSKLVRKDIIVYHIRYRCIHTYTCVFAHLHTITYVYVYIYI